MKAGSARSCPNNTTTRSSPIELAKQEGGRVLCGGTALHPEGRCKNGWFIAPTVIEGLSYDCRTNQEEIFGPVVTPCNPSIRKKKSRNTRTAPEYGLACSLWTSNLSRIAPHGGEDPQRHRLGELLAAARPAHTLRRYEGSGVGREGGFEALRFYEEKNVCIRL